MATEKNASSQQIDFEKQLVIENLAADTTINSLRKCFKIAIQQCGTVSPPSLTLAVDKRGKSRGFATLRVHLSKVDTFLQFDGQYLDGSQLKVSIGEGRDISSTWETPKSGVFQTTPTMAPSGGAPFRYNLVDAGLYLTPQAYKNPDVPIHRAISCGIKKMVTLGSTVSNSREGLQLARLYSGSVFCTAGVSPMNAVTWTDETELQLEDVAKCSECVAIGPCGFNLKTDALVATVEQQQWAFEKQIQLACRLKKPLLVKDVKASDEVLTTLCKYSDQLHKVAILIKPDTKDRLNLYFSQGFYVFVTGNGWNKGAKGTWAFMFSPESKTYLDHILVSSQAPHDYLGFVHQQSERSRTTELTRFLIAQSKDWRPCLLPALVELIASYLDMENQSVASQLEKNALTFYGFVKEETQEETQEEHVSSPPRSDSGLSKGYFIMAAVVAIAACMYWLVFAEKRS